MPQTFSLVDRDDRTRRCKINPDGSLSIRTVAASSSNQGVPSALIANDGLPIPIAQGEGFVSILQVPAGIFGVVTVSFVPDVSLAGNANFTARITDGVINRIFEMEAIKGAEPLSFSLALGPGIEILARKDNAGVMLVFGSIKLGFA